MSEANIAADKRRDVGWEQRNGDVSIVLDRGQALIARLTKTGVVIAD